MICPSCMLPDNYHGDGDGIGSCDCIRCDCCGAGPQECECRRDWDDDYDDSGDPGDYLCNDTVCPRRQARMARKDKP